METSAATVIDTNTLDDNPYRGSGGEPLLRRSTVAFVDILGYTERTKKAVAAGKAAEELRTLRDALDDAYKLVNRHHEPVIGTKRFSMVRSFTDNLILAQPIPDAVEDVGSVISATWYLAAFQMKMGCAGYFVRGALSVGDVYVDQEIVWGPALLDAHDAEQNVARVPRIVVCQSAYAALDEEAKLYHKQPGTHLVQGFVVDSDGRAFIDYLDETVMIAYPDGGPFTEILIDHKAQLEKALVDNGQNPIVRAKYEWAAAYHNYFCQRYPSLFGASEMIDTALLNQPFGPLHL